MIEEQPRAVLIDVHGVVPLDNELLLDTAGDAMERHYGVSVSDLSMVVVVVVEVVALTTTAVVV